MSDSGSICDAVSQSDAFDSASENSERSSTLSYELSRSRGRSQKRTITVNITSSLSQSNRLKFLYNDDYRELFNTMINETVSVSSSEKDDLLQESQIGVSRWTSEEKRVFFCALARRGRHDIQGIATDIGTKSESEVQVYSDALYKASVYQQTHSSRKNLLDISNLEAALEIREDCCAALDLTAEALSALQQNEEKKTEKKIHKELALLTPRIARLIERCIEVPEVEKEGLIHQIPAASLLNLSNLLVLSKRFFMNSIIPEDNWRSYTRRGAKSPSIMYTAFSDFHALVMSITQRLVQSSLYFAMSRLKATSVSGYYTPESYVRRRDVRAAINVLGMKTDAKVFWARMAQKCRLRVYDKVRRRQVFGKRYSYTDLKRILFTGISDTNGPETIYKDASRPMSRRGHIISDLSAEISEDSVLSGSMSADVDRSRASPNYEELSATPLHSLGSRDLKQEGHEELQDEYIEVLDQQAGLDEECRLWEKLGEDPTEKMEGLDVKFPKRPLPARKDEIELLHWMDSVDYVRDWEMRELPEFGSSFGNSGDIKMDDDSTAGSTSSGYSSGRIIGDETTKTEPGSKYYHADNDVTNSNRSHRSSVEEDRNFKGQ